VRVRDKSGSTSQRQQQQQQQPRRTPNLRLKNSAAALAPMT
jgi:hypothetical protein